MIRGIETGYEVLSYDSCNLCPRLCGARRDSGNRGACGADGAMHIARAALHYWEEPPISGEAGSGTVFFSGCPLHCVYCQNAVIASGGVGPAVSVERLAAICLELQAQGALNVNFVTPTHYTLHIIDAVRLARDGGLRIPVVWNTSGYEREQVVRALEGTVDVYLADYKYADAELARRYSHAPDYPDVAITAIRAMAQQVGEPRFSIGADAAFDNSAGASAVLGCTEPRAVELRVPNDSMQDERMACGSEAVSGEDSIVPGDDGIPRLIRGVVVRHLLLPGALEESKRALSVLWNEFGDAVLYSIMNQYTPVISGSELARFPELGETVPSGEYEELLDFADSLGMEDYFWQDGSADAQSFIPSWNGEGVEESSSVASG